MRISDWSSDVCSSDLHGFQGHGPTAQGDQQGVGKNGGDARCARELGHASLAYLSRSSPPYRPGCLVAARALDAAAMDTAAADRALRRGAAPSYAPPQLSADRARALAVRGAAPLSLRSEEHTSELQSLMRISYAVFCLKKKNNNQQKNIYKSELQK